MDKTTTMKSSATTGALNLDELNEQQIRSLQDRGYIARRMGALPGFSNNEYWQLTYKGEQLWHLV